MIWMDEKTPKRPSNLSIYGEACLRALAQAGGSGTTAHWFSKEVLNALEAFK
jgi:hypothetical protein